MAMFDEDGRRFLNAGVMSAEPRGRKRAEGVWLPGQHGAVVVGAEPRERTLGWTREDAGDPAALREKRQRQAIMQGLEPQRSVPGRGLRDQPQAPEAETHAMAQGMAGANAGEEPLGRAAGKSGATTAPAAFPGANEPGGRVRRLAAAPGMQPGEAKPGTPPPAASTASHGQGAQNMRPGGTAGNVPLPSAPAGGMQGRAQDGAEKAPVTTAASAGQRTSSDAGTGAGGIEGAAAAAGIKGDSATSSSASSAAAGPGGRQERVTGVPDGRAASGQAAAPAAVAVAAPVAGAAGAEGAVPPAGPPQPATAGAGAGAGFVGGAYAGRDERTNERRWMARYRDAQGRVHEVPLDEIHRQVTAGGSGETAAYEFDVPGPDGRRMPVTVAEGAQPLFRVDQETQQRLVDVKDEATGQLRPQEAGSDAESFTRHTLKRREQQARAQDPEAWEKTQTERLATQDTEDLRREVEARHKAAEQGQRRLEELRRGGAEPAQLAAAQSEVEQDWRVFNAGAAELEKRTAAIQAGMKAAEDAQAAQFEEILPGAGQRFKDMRERLRAKAGALNERFPGGEASSPEASAAWKALREEEDLEQRKLRRDLYLKQFDRRDNMRVIRWAMEDAGWWEKGGASQDQLNAAMRQRGLDPENWETRQMVMDVHRMHQLESEDVPDWDRKSPLRGGTGSAVLSDGSLEITPGAVQDDELYKAIVDASAAAPEEKAKALQKLPQLQLALAEAVLPMLKHVGSTRAAQWLPGIQSFQKWQAEKPRQGSEVEQARDYLKEMQGRGFWEKVPETWMRSVLAGFSDIGSRALGLAGLAGSQWASELAGDIRADADEFVGTMGVEGLQDGAVLQGTAMVGRMLPPVVADVMLTRGLGRFANLGTAGRVAVMSALAGAGTAGGQYAQTYNALREQGKSHAEAWRQTAPYAVASGLVTAMLTAAGGATGKEAALGTGAGMASARQAAQGFWKKLLMNVPKHALAELPQELPDELFSQISSALAVDPKADIGKVVEKFAQDSPALIGAIMVMGGGGGALSTALEGGTLTPPGLGTDQAQGKGNAIPDSAINGGSTAVKAPVPSLEETHAAQDTIAKLKGQNAPLSPVQVRELDAAERMVAARTEHNLLKKQEVIGRVRGEKLNAEEAKALADAQARLAQPVVEAGTPGPDGAQPQPTEGAPPSLEETYAAQEVIARLKAQQAPLSPAQARELDAAERVVAARIAHNLLKKQEVIGRVRGEKLDASEAKALAEAQARLARPVVGGEGKGPRPGLREADGGETAAGNAPAASPTNSNFSQSNSASSSIRWLTPREPQHLEPTMPYDVNRPPSGPPKALPPDDNNPGHIRGFNAENEAAKVLAQHGYEYRQISEANGSPDGKVGSVPDKWDVFAPASTKSMKGIHDVVTSKVQEQNAPYVIVRIESGGQDIPEMAAYFKSHPVDGLKQLFVIKDGQLYIIR